MVAVDVQPMMAIGQESLGGRSSKPPESF